MSLIRSILEWCYGNKSHSVHSLELTANSDKSEHNYNDVIGIKIIVV